MTIEQKYKKLDEISHVLLRPGRYIGSIVTHTAESYVLNDNAFIKEETSWNPAFLKIFDEILTNSVDHSKTENGSHLDTIKVDIDKDTGKISVYDNGGIPVIKHSEHNQYIPEMIFELRAGSNFNDNDENVDFVGGTHGEGAALTNIMSVLFNVETCDGKNKFVQTHTDNSRTKTEPVVKKSKEKYTKITYQTDFPRFSMDGLDDGNYQKLVKRIYDVAGCNPKLKIYLNDTIIKIKSFKDYINMYTDVYTFDQNDNWQVGVSKSEGSFSHISFVNGVETSIGGNHVNYIADQIISKLREYITKKHKIQVKPSEIKNHLNLFINCNIVRPRYSSQTKEDMITEIKNFGTTFEVSDKFIKEVINSEIVQSILDWAQAKENALMQAELRKLNKNTDKVDPIRVDNFEDASERIDRSKCICFFTEGLSAATAVISARDTKIHATFPLKGKPVNVNGISPKKLMENAEFKNILTITGLKLGEKVTSPRQLRFGKLCFLTDADFDGSHIVGLLVNMFHTFWPELFELGMIYRFKTPLIKVTVGKEIIEFYDEADFKKWEAKNKNKKFTSKYFKGLGTSTSKDFKGYLENSDKNLIKYEIDDQSDVDSIHLAFSKDAGKTNANNRKNWLALLDE